MLFLEGELVRLKEIRMLGLAYGKGKGFYYLVEGFFVLIRKEIEEDFPEKVLLNARPISL